MRRSFTKFNLHLRRIGLILPGVENVVCCIRRSRLADEQLAEAVMGEGKWKGKGRCERVCMTGSPFVPGWRFMELASVLSSSVRQAACSSGCMQARLGSGRCANAARRRSGGEVSAPFHSGFGRGPGLNEAVCVRERGGGHADKEAMVSVISWTSGRDLCRPHRTSIPPGHPPAAGGGHALESMEQQEGSHLCIVLRGPCARQVWSARADEKVINSQTWLAGHESIRVQRACLQSRRERVTLPFQVCMFSVLSIFSSLSTPLPFPSCPLLPSSCERQRQRHPPPPLVCFSSSCSCRGEGPLSEMYDTHAQHAALVTPREVC